MVEVVERTLRNDVPVEQVEIDDPLAPLMKYRVEVDTEHIQCVCRIPNKFQKTEIQEHALAARAARLRQFKDPDSKANLIVDAMMDRYESTPDDEIKEIIVGRSIRDCVAKAQMFIEHADPETFPEYRKFTAITKNQLRLEQMERRNETGTDEYKAVKSLIHEYAEAIEEKTEEYLIPVRAELEALDREHVLQRLRKIAMKDHADEAFMKASDKWEIYYGTRQLINDEKLYYSSIEDVENEMDEILTILEQNFIMLSTVKGLEAKKVHAPTPSSPSSEQSESLATGE